MLSTIHHHVKKTDGIIKTAVHKLSYREAKNRHIKSIKKFVSGNDVFQCNQYVLGSLSLMDYNVIDSHILHSVAQLFTQLSQILFFRAAPIPGICSGIGPIPAFLVVSESVRCVTQVPIPLLYDE